jgi:hypothetical protein
LLIVKEALEHKRHLSVAALFLFLLLLLLLLLPRSNPSTGHGPDVSRVPASVRMDIDFDQLSRATHGHLCLVTGAMNSPVTGVRRSASVRPGQRPLPVCQLLRLLLLLLALVLHGHAGDMVVCAAMWWRSGDAGPGIRWLARGELSSGKTPGVS